MSLVPLESVWFQCQSPFGSFVPLISIKSELEPHSEFAGYPGQWWLCDSVEVIILQSSTKRCSRDKPALETLQLVMSMILALYMLLPFLSIWMYLTQPLPLPKLEFYQKCLWHKLPTGVIITTCSTGFLFGNQSQMDLRHGVKSPWLCWRSPSWHRSLLSLCRGEVNW